MGRRFLVFALFLLLMGQFFSAYAASVTVKTDKSQYYQGDAVHISGTAPAGSQVAIQVKDPGGSTIFVDQVTASGGTFSTSFRLKSNAKLGTYTVYASCSAGKATTTFKVVSRPGPPPAPPGPAPTGKEIANRTIAELWGLINGTGRALDMLSQLFDVAGFFDWLDNVSDMYEYAVAMYRGGDYKSAYSKAANAIKELKKLWADLSCTSVKELGKIAKEYMNSGDADLVLIGETIDMLLSFIECPLEKLSTEVINSSLVVFESTANLVKTADRIKELKASLSEYESKVEELESENVELKKQIETLKAQLAECKKKVEGVLEDYSKLKGDYERVKGERDQLAGKVSSLEEEVARLMNEVASAKGMGYMMAAIALIVGFIVGVIVGKVVLGRRSTS